MAIIRPDDLAPGMFVTVHRGVQCQTIQYAAGAMITSEQEYFSHLKGMPIQVQAISLPYICGTIVGCNPERVKVVLDLRAVDLCKVSQDYVGAVSGTMRFPGQCSQQEGQA